jgi:hypothetical protein
LPGSHKITDVPQGEIRERLRSPTHVCVKVIATDKSFAEATTLAGIVMLLSAPHEASIGPKAVLFDPVIVEGGIGADVEVSVSVVPAQTVSFGETTMLTVGFGRTVTVDVALLIHPKEVDAVTV